MFYFILFVSTSVRYVFLFVDTCIFVYGFLFLDEMDKMPIVVAKSKLIKQRSRKCRWLFVFLFVNR